MTAKTRPSNLLLRPWEGPSGVGYGAVMARRTEVAIVGAGAIGLSCARELAGAGAGVTVLEEQASVGRGSSARANGGIRAQFTTEINVAFSRFSIGAIEELERSVGGLGLHQTGYLLITGTADGARSLREACDLQRRLEVGTEWLEPADVVARAPFIRPDSVRGGTFHARDGFLDPAGLVAALANEARRMGATVRTDAAVRSIAPGFVIEHARGRTRADVVVNAAGASARAVARIAGSDVPVEPVRRNLAHVMDPAAGSWRTPTRTTLRGGTPPSIPPSSRHLRRDSPTGSRSCSSSRSIRGGAGRAYTPKRPITTRSSARIRGSRGSSTASGSGDMA